MPGGCGAVGGRYLAGCKQYSRETVDEGDSIYCDIYQHCFCDVHGLHQFYYIYVGGKVF